jgi:hypothetical protein
MVLQQRPNDDQTTAKVKKIKGRWPTNKEKEQKKITKVM